MFTPACELDFDHTVAHDPVPWRHELRVGQRIGGQGWWGVVTFAGDEDAVVQVTGLTTIPALPGEKRLRTKVGERIRLLLPVRKGFR